jgi:hypothetical protein
VKIKQLLEEKNMGVNHCNFGLSYGFLKMPKA